jgi:clan AA aspartic protease
MGLTNQKILIKESRHARRKKTVNFLIDSGAVYSLVPEATLKKLGIRPYRKVDFALADGTTITRRVGDAYFEFRGEGGAAPVIFGEKGDEPLLGATTLESIGLVLDPFKRRLIPMRMLLGRSTSVASCLNSPGCNWRPSGAPDSQCFLRPGFPFGLCFQSTRQLIA